MNWEITVQVAQVAATVLLGIGIIISLWIGIKTLREVHSDRIHRVYPRLLFNRGGQVVKCKLAEADGIMGIDPKFAAELLKSKPSGVRSCIPLTFWGELTNHGNGSALNVTITILTRRVHKAGADFLIDSEKLLEFPYSPHLNMIPANPSNIEPGGSAEFLRIPTPVFVDFSGLLTRMECIAVIDYEDMYGNKYQTLQELYLHIQRFKSEANVTLTFGEEVLPISKVNTLK